MVKVRTGQMHELKKKKKERHERDKGRARKQGTEAEGKEKSIGKSQTTEHAK